MKNYRFLLIVAIVVIMGLVMVASVSAQEPIKDQIKAHDHLQDGSCEVCPNPDCDGVPDMIQLHDRIGVD